MPLFFLMMKAETENVGSVTLRQDANLRISVRNPLNPDEVRENVVIDPSEIIELDGTTCSREPSHHFHLTWEGSKKASILQVHSGAEKAISVLKGSSKKKYKGETPRSYTAEDSGNWVPLLLLECRGMEPYAFHPMEDEFEITSEAGCAFNENIELDDDWADYDADNDAPVSLSEIEFEFKSV
mmetsp:Transcript_28239/g.41720  ORF Transcript_28239/g.41720 Transcript_28239/m.41720 type:complete len:183 (-) Transcript_28239:103-651(-)|eukprot:CAMPEP_0194203784 /NCGR_PEP_ID=MMETSP0156-20130528/3467_1 /TAXON_ID=33649 /ORGANISM="Thalassionema nitzschioides, Strain L26-B" /LENGTH=182 /DNA_ID=CAMNT_0038929607 /DNA_START=123 /DNA_END=671 /DNA_ORIENTATION=+